MTSFAPTLRLGALMLFSFLLIATPSFSQEFEVEWGEEFKAEKRDFLIDIIGFNDQGYYVLKRQKNKLYIDHFDQSNSLVASNELKLEYKGKDMGLEFIIQLGDEFFVFASFKNQKHKKNYLFVQPLDPATAETTAQPTNVATIDYANASRYNGGSYKVAVSRDDSKVAVFYNPPYKKNQPEKIGVVVMDNEMNTLWTKEDQLPYLDNMFSITFNKVDNLGNVYLAGLLEEDQAEARKHRGADFSFYHVLGYFNEGKELRDFELKPADKLISALEFSVNEEGNLVVGGFYKEKPDPNERKRGGIKGSFFMTVDGKTKKPIKTTFSEFSLDFILQNFSEKQEKKAKKKLEKGKEPTLFSYYLDEIVLRDDGGAVLIGEQYYVRESTRTTTDANGNTTTRTVYYYYYNDIIVVSVDPDGDIDWTHKIPKYQTSVNDGGFYASYAYAVVDDKIYFVFNDNPKNSTLKEGDRPARFSPGIPSEVVAYSIDSKGYIERNVVAKQEKRDLLLRPKMCEQVSAKELVLFTRWKKGRKYGKMVFE